MSVVISYLAVILIRVCTKIMLILLWFSLL